MAEIDSGINAALALLSPPSSQLQDLALRAGLAGQLEVSSLRHSRPAFRAGALAEPPCFCLHPESLMVGTKPMFCSPLALSLNLSDLPFVFPQGLPSPSPPSSGTR